MPASVYTTASVRPSKPANLTERSVGFCYSVKRNNVHSELSQDDTDQLHAHLDALSQSPRSIGAASNNGTLDITFDRQSIGASLLTTLSNTGDTTGRPCFVVRWDQNENKADVLLLATFGGRSARKLDSMMQKFVASVHPTRAYPDEQAIVAYTNPEWTRSPQHILLLVTQCDASSIFPSRWKKKKVPAHSLVNYNELLAEASRRNAAFEKLSAAEQALAWRSYYKQRYDRHRHSPYQSQQGTALSSVSGGSNSTAGAVPALSLMQVLESVAGSTSRLPASSAAATPDRSRPPSTSPLFAQVPFEPSLSLSSTPAPLTSTSAITADSGTAPVSVIAAQDPPNPSHEAPVQARAAKSSTQRTKEQKARIKAERAAKLAKDAGMAKNVQENEHGTAVDAGKAAKKRGFPWSIIGRQQQKA
ncbi:hypothetical protein BKA62DRAFT_835370 [Auriculariales sp. MPI-PUGE-AT-0066]|nr:hypothetical protein BKA62DRAFT_835370 [Auriculariales sp. MPI-PUGE-AT-0066]